MAGLVISDAGMLLLMFFRVFAEAVAASVVIF